MPRDDPFAIAGRDARRAGVCPVTLLDPFFSNHWDFDSLCGGFSCRECVATPEDTGLGGPREEAAPAARFEEEEDWEIPF